MDSGLTRRPRTKPHEPTELEGQDDLAELVSLEVTTQDIRDRPDERDLVAEARDLHTCDPSHDNERPGPARDHGAGTVLVLRTISEMAAADLEDGNYADRAAVCARLCPAVEVSTPWTADTAQADRHGR